jgi:serine/threonine-protein kinase
MKPGDRFGRYTLVSAITQRGMAEVWQALVLKPNGFRQKVVLKVLLPQLAKSESFVQMFVNDALLAARLGHRNIAQVYELGRAEGCYFIVLEYVPGKTLREILDRLKQQAKPPPLWFAPQVVAAACDGLQYAHRFRDEEYQPLEVPHRDISSDNIMVSFRGAVKILNFGLANASAMATSILKHSTQESIAYHCPERVKGDPLDRRCDIYSLGIVLYELLSDVRLPKDRGMLKRLLEGEVADHGLPSIPQEVETALWKAIAEDPADRYNEARELADDLRAYIEDKLATRSPNELGEFVSGLFRAERGPIPTPQYGSPAVAEMVVDGAEGSAPEEGTTLRFKREDGSTFSVSGLEGWEFGAGVRQASYATPTRLSTQSMPVIQVQRLTRKTSPPSDPSSDDEE